MSLASSIFPSIFIEKHWDYVSRYYVQIHFVLWSCGLRRGVVWWVRNNISNRYNDSIFDSEDEGSMFLRHISTNIPIYTAMHNSSPSCKVSYYHIFLIMTWKLQQILLKKGIIKTAYAAKKLVMGKTSGIRFTAASPLHSYQCWNKPCLRSRGNRDAFSQNNAIRTWSWPLILI
jgi:hypothetical protein